VKLGTGNKIMRSGSSMVTHIGTSSLQHLKSKALFPSIVSRVSIEFVSKGPFFPILIQYVLGKMM
jgi:hypothetical protein